MIPGQIATESKEPISKQHASKYLYALNESKVIQIARKDPDTFINYAMSFKCPSSGPGMWYPPREACQISSGEVVGVTCRMHRDWQDSITNYDKVYIEGPREHAKTQRTMGRIIWELGNNPNLRIKIVCQNDEKASELVTAISSHILTNERVKRVFPDLEPDIYGQWARHKIYVKRKVISRDASLEASGVLATGVGGRADILVFDDPVDFKNAIQFPAMRDTVKQAYFGVWLNLLPNDGGKIIYICTPWHMKDLSLEIKTNHKEYKMCSDPIDDAITPVWPTKWNKQSLLNRQRDIGSREFDRGFKLKALSDEDALFKMQDFIRCYDYTISLGCMPGHKDPGPKSDWKYFTAIDLGIGRKTSSPRSSIYTFGINRKGLKIPAEIKIGRWGESEKIHQLNVTYRRWQSEIIAVENNSYQESFLGWCRDIGAPMPIKGIYTGSQKVDLHTGLPSLAVEIENNMWTIPALNHTEDGAGSYGKSSCNCPVCQWISECVSFPVGFSDILMSWWIAREGYRLFGSRTGRIRSI